MAEKIAMVLQLILALGLLNVWLLRARSKTAYRGGEATDLKGEFAAYGLPNALFYAVGALKVGAALALLLGLAIPALVAPAAGILIVLMLAALAMHLKIRDPLLRSVPALLMLTMSAAVLGIEMG